MSLRTTGHQPTYPGTTTIPTDTAAITDTATTTLASTTATNGSTTTTTTLVTTTASSTTTTSTRTVPAASPRMVGHTEGSHDSTLGLNWALPETGASLRALPGLPPLQAAIINDDWALAATMLSTENIDRPWGFDLHRRPAWQNDLRKPDSPEQKLAIIDMAFALAEASTIKGADCLHGTSLLTLCLKKHAPTEFLEKLIAAIKSKKTDSETLPDTLDRPDPSGRTPLYVAVEQGDQAQVDLLLKNGADPLAKCNFQQISDCRDMPTAHHAAVVNGQEEIFRILLKKSTATSTWETSFRAGEDLLSLFKWTSAHDRDEVLALASDFPCLKPILLNSDDRSGTSEIYRCVKNGEWPETDFHPLGRSQLEKKPIFVAAVCGHADIFFRMVGMCIENSSFDLSAADKRRLIAAFLLNTPDEQAARLLDHWPDAARLLCDALAHHDFLTAISKTFEKYSTIVRMAWPCMKRAERNNLLLDTANRQLPHLELVISLDPQRVQHYSWDIFSIIAAYNHKTELFEIAETYSKSVATAIAKFSADESSPMPKGQITQILRARSTKLFEAFLQAGLQVQELLDIDNDHYLSLMADCDPSRLPAWLAGCQFTVTPDTIANLRTEAGLAALQPLQALQAL